MTLGRDTYLRIPAGRLPAALDSDMLDVVCGGVPVG